MSLKVHKKRDHYQEVLHQINSKLKQAKAQKVNMVNNQFSQMNIKKNNKKIKSSWKIVKKYLKTIKKHKKC